MSKKVKILVKILLFVAIYILVQVILKFVLLDDTMTISRVMMHDMYSSKDNIDVLFCGASHCQLGFNTEVLDQELGCNTFNAGSSSQGLETSLALIREVAQKNSVDHVYVDLDYSIVTRTAPNLESIYIISDYMRPSVKKFSYLLNATDFDYYFNSFMPFHMNRGYIKNPKDVIGNIKKKISPGYYNYEEIDESYGGKGYIASQLEADENSLVLFDERIVIGELTEEQIRRITDIIDYCRKESIELTFVNLPITEFYMNQIDDYSNFENQIRRITDQYGVEYWDFNTLEGAFPTDNLQYFNDDNHLNVKGSTYFAHIFSELAGNAG